MSTSDDLRIRLATPDDAPIIAEQRVSMFVETRPVSDDTAAALRAQLPDLLRQMLETASYTGWLAETGDGTVVAGAGVHIRRLLPRAETLVACEALVVNVYVAPEFRHQGLARRLMEGILAWCRGQGIERVVLHPSSMGRSLYDSLGFVPTNELVYYVK
jgi:GNAT superfamily N-acetyltransferase